ncbi:DNA-binding protein WhiA [Rubrobacter marinus]|uniref:Probable cell division protein WhiA n=1 Tax=Rubrobacter marinus TaxID=2653852 RepID=A0A6G8PVM6_9ACTN|nr:DNA-binding protein WhiA [Rubrobacter marinus]QIN78233.1 DNA-binding protein WhiA [Rubrobacter marinus]
MPSFASELRRQLAATGPGPGRRAELAGLLDAAGTVDETGATVRTTSAPVARSMMRLWRSEFGLEPRLTPSSPGSFGRQRYAVRVEGNRALQAIEELRVERARAARGGTAGISYLRGAFQGAGSLTGPGYRRGHHLEFVHESEELVRRVAGLSTVPMKLARRRGRHVAYTKSAEGVTTILARMGLHDAVLEYEARAIVGEAKANANRVTNFDAANANRTAVAAALQGEALENLDPGRLPPALREMLELRLEHPDASLAELARLGGLSKSAANHRLRRLVELAGAASAPSGREAGNGGR